MNNYGSRTGLSEQQKIFFALLGEEKPKPIPPVLVRLYGYTLAAMISQLLYWCDKGKRDDGLIYKTEKDLVKEIGTSSAQQKLAIKKGKDFGFLEVTRRGIPARRHYRIDYDKLVDATFHEADRKGIKLSKGFHKFVENSQSRIGNYERSITNNTKKITTKRANTESVAEIVARMREKM